VLEVRGRRLEAKREGEWGRMLEVGGVRLEAIGEGSETLEVRGLRQDAEREIQASNLQPPTSNFPASIL
jgi:hypothetical protein